MADLIEDPDGIELERDQLRAELSRLRQMDDEMVERACAAGYESAVESGLPGLAADWDHVPEHEKAEFRVDFRKALEAALNDQ